MNLRGLPALCVHAEGRSTRARVDPRATIARRPLLTQPPLGVDLLRKGARPFAAVGSAVRRLPANAPRVLLTTDRHESPSVGALRDVDAHTLSHPGFDIGASVTDVTTDPRRGRTVSRDAPIAQGSNRHAKVPRQVLNSHQFAVWFHAPPTEAWATSRVRGTVSPLRSRSTSTDVVIVGSAVVLPALEEVCELPCEKGPAGADISESRLTEMRPAG
jgi:hypothetical protein